MPESHANLSLGEPRESFMGRVRAALERERTAPPSESAPAVDESLARLASADDDLLGLFTQRAEAVGMKVHRTTRAELNASILAVLDALGAQRVAVAAGAVGRELKLDAALREGGREVVDWRSRPGMAAQYELDAGITDVHAALAETGTLVCSSGHAHSRGLSLVPPSHLALVRRSDVLPDMIDYWTRMKGIPALELPSSTVFITGPSKTADIEGELITGVHGPGEVHILLIEDA